MMAEGIPLLYMGAEHRADRGGEGEGGVVESDHCDD